MLLGRFERLRHLHTGGTAEIHLGRQWGDGGFHRPVVLKQLHAALAEDPYALIRFQDEARILATLHHPAFPALWDLRCAGSTWFMALELVTGWRLDQVLELDAQRGHPLPLGVSLSIATQLCEALAHAHASEVVHGGVTSANLVLEVEGGVRLLDLGTAQSPLRRHVGAAIHHTVAYLSPEQVSGDAVDARTDVFAVGALLYRLTTGALPFDITDDLELLTAIVEQDPLPPRARRSDCPEELSAIVMGALARDPAQRMASAAELARALSGFALREGVLVGQKVLSSYLASTLPRLAPYEELEGEPRPPSFVVSEAVSPDEVEMLPSTELALDLDEL